VRTNSPTITKPSVTMSIPASQRQHRSAIVTIELDEELHFNRFRAQTLAASWYERVSWAQDYARLCGQHERRCLDAGKWVQRWTTSSCEILFGPAGPAGQIAGAGAPRWRQRALYDAIKDLVATSPGGPKSARLSVYDRVDGRSLEWWLHRPTRPNRDRLLGLIDSRLSRTD
jgi:hypothetical protein